MNTQQILDELVHILETNGVHVRTESLAGQGGGLCTMQGKHIMFVDSEAPTLDAAAACAAAIREVVDIEQFYIVPQVRQFIEQCPREFE